MKRDSLVLILVLIALSVGNVLLIWWFRFLPLFDYPIWLYESYILRNIALIEFSAMFELARAPVPNMGLTGLLYLTNLFLPIETAGKVLLSFCVIAFPWSLRYCAISMGARPDSPIACFGFPFAFGPYFFAGQGFYIGLVFFFLVLGYAAKKAKVPLLVYALIFVMGLFLHGLIFFILASTLLILQRSREFQKIVIAMIPAILLLVMDKMVNVPAVAVGGWSVWSALQATVKPFLVFTKSYGISPVVSLTVLNALWLCFLGVFIVVAVKQGVWGSAFLQAGIFLAGVAVVLPDNFLNIVQPGGRLILPAIALVLLGSARSNLSRIWTWVMAGVGGIVLIYNTGHFSMVNMHMGKMYDELRASGVLRNGRFAVVRFDWPPERDVRNVLAPSIDPLFGVAYYAALGEAGVGQVFGTSLVRTRHPDTMPTFHGATPEATANEIIRHFIHARPFDVLILVGAHPSRDRVMHELMKRGFVMRVKAHDWLVLQSREFSTQGK